MYVLYFQNCLVPPILLQGVICTAEKKLTVATLTIPQINQMHVVIDFHWEQY